MPRIGCFLIEEKEPWWMEKAPSCFKSCFLNYLPCNPDCKKNATVVFKYDVSKEASAKMLNDIIKKRKYNIKN